VSNGIDNDCISFLSARSASIFQDGGQVLGILRITLATVQERPEHEFITAAKLLYYGATDREITCKDTSRSVMPLCVMPVCVMPFHVIPFSKCNTFCVIPFCVMPFCMMPFRLMPFSMMPSYVMPCNRQIIDIILRLYRLFSINIDYWFID